MSDTNEKTPTTDIVDQASAAYDQAVYEWGAIRRYISAHPLTGFWAGIALGVSLPYAGPYVVSAVWKMIF